VVALISALIPVPEPPRHLDLHAGVALHELLGPALAQDDHRIRALDAEAVGEGGPGGQGQSGEGE